MRLASATGCGKLGVEVWILREQLPQRSVRRVPRDQFRKLGVWMSRNHSLRPVLDPARLLAPRERKIGPAHPCFGQRRADLARNSARQREELATSPQER